MKMCMKHWTLLRSAIHERGIWHLVAESGEQATANLQAELTEGPSKENFDPLMAAHFNIMGVALQLGGLYLMTQDVCPVCEAMEHMKNQDGSDIPPDDIEKDWINGPADAALNRARELGLAPPTQ